MRVLRSSVGQASVELVAVLPCVCLVTALAWQVALAGHAAWAVAGAARAAARATAVGSDAREAANAALPVALERHSRVVVARDGTVKVQIRVPAVLPGFGLGTIVAHSRFERQGR